MSSAFWLLLYLAPLLALTAAVFGWLGWHWRGNDLRQPAAEPGAPAATTSETPPVVINDASAELEQSHRDRAGLQEALKAAQADAAHRSQEAAKSLEASRALEAETRRLTQDLDLLCGERDRAGTEAASLRQERDSLATQLATTQDQSTRELTALRGERDRLAGELTALRAELEQLRALPAATEAASAPTVPAVPVTETEKPKRKRTTATKPRKAAPVTSLREKITALMGELTLRQAALGALTQEHADWQRRVSKLEAATPGDPAALGLARRSLSDSEKRLQSATAEVSRLQNQAAVLQRVDEQNATLTLAADDDLTQIKGIKKVICEQLHAHGIRTWRQIAQWNDDELSAFSDLLAFKNRASREKWREQARALHEAAHGPLP